MTVGGIVGVTVIDGCVFVAVFVVVAATAELAVDVDVDVGVNVGVVVDPAANAPLVPWPVRPWLKEE